MKHIGTLYSPWSESIASTIRKILWALLEKVILLDELLVFHVSAKTGHDYTNVWVMPFALCEYIGKAKLVLLAHQT